MGALSIVPQQPKHHKQIEALNDPARFKFWLAGRRGGKTIGMVEDILESVNSCPRSGEVFYIGPTNKDAMDLIWEKLEERLDQLGWKYQAKISKQCFYFSRKRKIYVIGAEKIRRIRGHKVWRAYLDEVAFFSTPLKTVWKAVRPSLSDLKGRAICATTPNGKGTDAYDFYLDIKAKHNWKFFHWYTEDNPYIDRDELEEAKSELDEKSYNQEYRAGWESFEGLAYYNYDEHLHEKQCDPIDLFKPIVMGLDFNVAPTTLLIKQKHGTINQYKKEYSLKRGSTENTVKTFCEDLDQMLKDKFGTGGAYYEAKSRVRLLVRGDATGSNEKSNTGKSDYHYVEEVLKQFGFPYTKQVPRANPPIVDRVKHANAYLKNMLDEVRVQIDPSCKELIRDLSSQETDGREPVEKNGLGHKADAFGYDIYWEFMNSDRPRQAPGMVPR